MDIIYKEYNFNNDMRKLSEETNLIFGDKEMYYKGGRWIYNYKKIFAELIPQANIKIYSSKKNYNAEDDWSIYILCRQNYIEQQGIPSTVDLVSITRALIFDFNNLSITSLQLDCWLLDILILILIILVY